MLCHFHLQDMGIFIVVTCFALLARISSANDVNRTIAKAISTNATRRSNRTNAEEDNTTNGTISSGAQLHIDSIEKFCMIIAKPNCSCHDPVLHEEFPTIVPTLCGVDELVEEYERAYFPKKRLTLASVTTVSMVFGLAGNVLVIAVSYRNRKNLPYTKILISQLALVDAIFSINNFLSEVHLFWSAEWILGEGMCKLVSSTYTLSSLLSIGYILIIALERYFGILYSMQRKLSSKQLVYGSVVTNFILGIAAVIPLFVSTTFDDTYGVCYDSMFAVGAEFEKIYNWVLISVFIVVPMLIICAIYVRIIHYLLVQAKKNTAINREDLRLKRNKSNQRTMRILISIMLAFLVCVLPTRLCKLYLAYFRDGGTAWAEMEAFRLVASITYSLHVCVNPIIYSAVDRESRRDMLSVVGFRRPRLDSSVSTSRYNSNVRVRRETQFTVLPP